MRTIEMIQCQYDNSMHYTEKDANKHLEKLYSDLLQEISRDVTKLQKYVDTTAYIDKNLGKFTQLQRIKDDCIMTIKDNDEM